MTDARTLRLKNANLAQIGLVAMLIPFVVISLGFGLATFGSFFTAQDLRRHERKDPVLSRERGATLIAGEARRASPVTSPAGRSGIAWVAAVGYIAKGSKGRTWFEPLCVRADVSALTLEDNGSGPQSIRLDFVRPTDDVALAPSAGLRDEKVPQVWLGEVTSTGTPSSIPEWMRTSCTGKLTKPESDLLYRESVLGSGELVHVLACTSDGQVLVPCHDGHDLVSTIPITELMERRRNGERFMVIFGAVWNLLSLGVIGALLSKRLVSARLSVEEAAKRSA